MQYATHLAAALSAVTATLLPYYGSARWFIALPAVSTGLAALGIGNQAQQVRAAQASTPTSASGPVS